VEFGGVELLGELGDGFVFEGDGFEELLSFEVEFFDH
jgi:hypothetical protein